MSKRKAGRTVSGTTQPSNDRSALRVSSDPADREQLMANFAAEGLLTNAMLMKGYSESIAGPIGITEAMNALRVSLEGVSRGDLAQYETMLFGQAAALNAIFAEMARRSALNLGEYIDATDRYMRLALKAQGQCRATLETLAAIKNPPLVFARQANINNGGQQQVNNGVGSSGPAPARAEKSTSQPIGLLETSDVERLDAGAQGTAGGADQDLAPMGAINRPQDSSGQSPGRTQCLEGWSPDADTRPR